RSPGAGSGTQYGQQRLGVLGGLQPQAGQIATVFHGDQAALEQALGGGQHLGRSAALVDLQALVGIGQIELGQQVDIVNIIGSQGHGGASLWWKSCWQSSRKPQRRGK